MRTLLFLFLCCLGLLPARADGGAAEELSATQSRLVLNGVWRFQPAFAGQQTAPEFDTAAWGSIRVPGFWDSEGWDARWLEGILTVGQGRAWSAVKVDTVSRSRPTQIIKKLERAWYEREFTLPAAWQGREVVLRLETPSTDVQAWVDGRPAAIGVSWPSGEIDLTALVRFDGKPHTLRLLVAASAEARGISQAMDFDRVTVSKGVLDHRGVAGDALLLARPRARVDGVFIQPSFRRKELGLDVDFVGVKAGTAVALVISAQRGDTVVKEWSEKVTVPAPGDDGRATVRGLALPWADPVLWEAGRPELYTLSVRATGEALEDELRERFGFREFWIEGRQFFLNGTVYNFRPALIDTMLTDPAMQRLSLTALLEKNFNIGELWPSPDSPRGSKALILRHHWARVADELGFTLIYPLLSPDAWFDPLDSAPKPAAIAAWKKHATEVWRLTRNSPSVLVHNCVGNRFSHGDDQNPRRIGNRAALALGPVREATVAVPARRLIEVLRGIDSTRPVMSHHAADIGDIHTSNNYLNVTPLQERQDWLSQWSRTGDMPFMAVEFGAPFSGTYNRGRANHTGQDVSEPWLTEFIATYRGADAFLDEDPAYRRMIAEEHVNGFVYRSARVTRSSQLAPFQAFWVRETWPAWRTWGVSGGMIAWENANGFGYAKGDARFDPPAPADGTLGGYRSNFPATNLGLAAPGLIVNEAGAALIEANAPVRLWVAGPADDFTRKDHRFVTGETVKKSAVILNDTRSALAWQVQWSATVRGKIAGTAKAEGVIEPGRPVFVPLEFNAPEVGGAEEGVIEVQATIGGESRAAKFAFRVVPPVQPKGPSAAAGAIYCFDPAGASLALLRAVGSKPIGLVAGTLPPAGASLVIGRNAVLDPAFTPEWAAALTDWVRSGGRLLLLGQDPDWLRTHSGFRFARHVSRRAWPVATQREHPLMAGLDGEDFRDWRGDGSLIAAESQTGLDRPEIQTPSFRPPTYGWRWGTRGSVASASLEKPHLSGWTPILENEFDLAFTPLAELTLGRGYVLWCGLDLEARRAAEPMALEMAARLLRRVVEVKPDARRSVVYLGGEAGEKRLRELGVVFTKVSALSPGTQVGAQLAVIGADAGAFDLKGWLAAGGRALFLPRDGTALFPGELKAEPRMWSLARTLPDWPETRGLGLGDLRLRVDKRALVFSPAENVGADGALARIAAEKGDGVAILFQLDAAALPVADKTYLRFSQWRLNRATAQLLANLGASFAQDGDFLRFALPKGQPVVLGGEWRYQVEGELVSAAPSPSEPARDPGNRGLPLGWSRPEFDDSAWAKITLPMMMPELEKKDGALWFRREFTLPAEFVGQPLNLALGPLDDFEDVWLNGARIGGTPKGTPENWALQRNFKLRPGMAEPGRNVIAIRLWDQFGGGGFGAQNASQMRLEMLKPPVRATPYTPGYRDDYAQGDDYARYYRW